MPTTTERILQRALDEPGLVPAVQALAPEQLDALVRAVGLEDAGQLLAMATPEQFEHLIDTSLWRPDGDDEAFDHARFPIWLEVMLEGGEALACARLRALPEETVALAFAGQLLVLDRDTLGIDMAGASAREAELVEKALDACHYLELENYTLVARRSLGWDAVTETLLALDQVDHELTERVLADCCRASTELVEEDGLHNALSAMDALADDALGEREDRRAARGYVSRADAIAFTRLVERESPGELLSGPPPPRDAITRAYLQRLPATETSRAAPSRTRALPRALAEVIETAVTPPADVGRSLRGALARLPDARRAAREAELLLLANVLLASDRGYTHVRAIEEVLRLCARGLEHLRARAPDASLEDVGCDQLYRVGHALTRAAKQLRGG